MSMEAMATKKGGRPTSESSRQKIERIIEAARDMFTESGYRAVSMRDVAERAEVSTRTLYDRFADKLNLFTACLDTGATIFPTIGPDASAPVGDVLTRHAAGIAHALCQDMGVRISRVVYREGREFPELLRAAELNQDRYLIQPLAAYLREVGIEQVGETAKAKIFVAMALTEWQRRFTFDHPLPEPDEIEAHAHIVTEIFLHGHPDAHGDN